MFIPLDGSEDCASLQSINGEFLRNDEDYEPEIKINTNRRSKDQVVNIQRPRYYSTELGIRDKLFIGILTKEENINSQATALNKTIAHLANQIKFFITANVVKDNLTLSNVVGFTDTREMLKPFHLLKYVSDNYLEDFDYFFIISDVAFINGRRLLEIVNKISVSEDVYMGVLGEGDSQYCDLDAGILISNSVLKKVHENLDWCVRNSYSPQHFENIGRCVMHSTSLKCKDQIQGQKFSSIRLAPNWKPSINLVDVITAYPVNNPDHTYRLHAYVSKLYLDVVADEILSLRSFLVRNLAKHPADFRNATWPGGLKTDAGLAAPTPATRFDHKRWTSFNETHVLLPNDHTAVEKLSGSWKEDIDLILEAVWEHSRAAWPTLEPAGLVEGQWIFDQARALRYLLLLRFKDRETGGYTLRRLEVCKPLGQTHILSVPYVTESARITILLPVLPDYKDELTENAKEAMGFLNRYQNTCLEKGDKTFLLLVLIYTETAPSKGPDDPYEALKREALDLSDKYKESGGKVEWLSIRMPVPVESVSKSALRTAALELGLNRFTRDTLVLWAVPDMEFSADFLNRVRMNTIQGRQAFSPMPFTRYAQYLHPKFVDKDGNKPQTNTGHFDRDNRNVLSVYRADYDLVRHSAAQQTLPLLRTESDLSNYILVSSKIDTHDLPLTFLLTHPDLHILRAPEPGLIIRPRARPPCRDSDIGCLRRWQMERFEGLNFGSRTQLAKLALEG